MAKVSVGNTSPVVTATVNDGDTTIGIVNGSGSVASVAGDTVTTVQVGVANVKVSVNGQAATVATDNSSPIINAVASSKTIVAVNGYVPQVVGNAAQTAQWGGISGTLSTQSDLVAALAGKQSTNATLTSLAGLSWTSGTQYLALTGAGTLTLKSNVLDQTTADGLYQAMGSYESTVTAGTTGQYYRGDKSWQTLDKTAVGLTNVDNTSDANKPISTAVATALAGKQPTGNYATGGGTATGTNTGDQDLSGYATTSALTSGLATKQPTGNYATGGGTATGTNTGDQDLSGLATISDLTSGLSGKEPTITAGSTTQYWRGDKSWQTLDKTAVGLANVNNTSDASKPVSGATQTALNAKADLVGATFSGPISATNLSGTNTGDQDLSGYATTSALTSGLAGKANTVHTHVISDVTGLQTALDGKQTAGTYATGTGSASGTNTGDQTISITGDVTAAGGTGALTATVTKINGTSLAALGTGILKNTTSTGVPSIAVAADFPILNQNTTGSAAKLAVGHNFLITGGGITASAVSFDGTANVGLSASVDAGHITLARMANLNANTIIGNNTGSNATPLALTGANVTAMLSPVIASGAQGVMTGADKAKLDAITGTNTGDQDLSSYLTSATAATTYQAKGTYATGTGSASGTNTGDETKARVDTLIGVDGTTTTQYYRKDGTWATVTSGGGGAWGSITGTLSDQTDLSTALAGKQATGNYATGGGTATGTNTGDQTITLGGDISGSGTGSITATIGNGIVTKAKMANAIARSVIGRSNGSTSGVVADIQASNDGDVLWYDGNLNVVKFGQITGTSIINASVPLTALSTQSPLTILGNSSGSSSLSPSALTGAQATAILSAMVGANGTVAGTKGLVPAPAATDNLKFLRGDGTWQAVSGGSGTVTSVSVTTANGVSGTVTNPTTTPAITLTLGAITPSSVVATGSISGSNLSGTNTGDQTITLTGAVTGSGTGSFATTIAANAITRADLAATSGAAILGATAAGDVTDLTGTQTTTLLDTFTTALKGLAPASGGGTVNFLRADGAWAAPTATANTDTVNVGSTTEYVTTAPTTPTSGVTLFAGKRASRRMPMFVDPTGRKEPLQPFLGSSTFVYSQAMGGSTGKTDIGGSLTTSATTSAIALASTNYQTMQNKMGLTVSTSTGLNYICSLTPYCARSPGNSAGGFNLVWRFGFSALGTDAKVFVGVRGSTGAALGVPTNVNPSTVFEIIGFAKDSTDTTQCYIMVNGASGSPQKIVLTNTGSMTNITTAWFQVEFFCKANDTQIGYRVSRFSSAGVESNDEGTITGTAGAAGGIPSNAALFQPYMYSANTSAVANTFLFGSMYLEVD